MHTVGAQHITRYESHNKAFTTADLEHFSTRDAWFPTGSDWQRIDDRTGELTSEIRPGGTFGRRMKLPEDRIGLYLRIPN